MRIKQALFYLLLFVMQTSLTINLSAQVTMGSLEAPATGALLQLKNIEKITDGNANATKGLNMPRVLLTDILNLFPMFPIGYDKTEHDVNHTGLMVYNVNENLPNGDGAGMYVWDGGKWLGIGISKGSIVANPSLIYISEIKPTAVTALTVSDGASWTMSAATGINSSTHTTSSNNVTFTAVNGVYGDKTYTFSLQEAPDRKANVDVKHIHLAINNPEMKMGNNVTISNSSAVEAFGGDANWSVLDYTTPGFNWIAAPKNVGGSLNFQLGEATATNVDIVGTITVAHINDPTYTKTIKIIQNSNFITLPEFDFLLLQYRFNPSISDEIDIDKITTINGTDNPQIDYTAIGYGHFHESGPILKWGGDNRETGFEAAYAHIPNVLKLIEDNNPDAPKIFNIDMYAHWFMTEENYRNQLESAIPKRNTITISITLYKGGNMTSLNTYDFENLSGDEVFKLDVPNILITTFGMESAYNSEYWIHYTPAFRLEFDRIEKTGVIINNFTPVPKP